MTIFRGFSIFMLTCYICLINGCTQTIKVDPLPLPPPSNNSPISAPDKMTVLIVGFKDHRDNKNIIGLGSGLVITTDREVTEIVEGAIADQLKEAGYDVIGARDTGKPDVIIEGAVLVYWVDYDIFTISAFRDSATVEVKIAVTSHPEYADVPLTTYVGRSTIGDTFDNPRYVFKDAIRYSINAALLDMVKKFVGDARVSDVLNKTYELKNPPHKYQ